MEFAAESDRYEFVAANLSTIQGVVWYWWRTTRRIHPNDVEDHVQGFTLYLMTNKRPLDRFDETRSLRAYLGRVFYFWFAERCRVDIFCPRRTRASVSVVAEVFDFQKDERCELGKEEEEEDKNIYLSIRELEETILDVVAVRVEDDLDSTHFECFDFSRYERESGKIARHLAMGAGDVRLIQGHLKRYVRHLRINGEKLGDYFWRSVKAIRAGEDLPQIKLTFVHVKDDDPRAREIIWSKITKIHKTRGNFDYGNLTENECTSRQICLILKDHLPERNPYHKLGQWRRKGKIRLVRTNGVEGSSYHRVIYALDSVMALKKNLDGREELRVLQDIKEDFILQVRGGEQLQELSEKVVEKKALGKVLESEQLSGAVEALRSSLFGVVSRKIGERASAPVLEEFNDVGE